MLFRRKQQNRRLGREYVLDVKLRSSQIRAARTRKATFIFGVLFASVFAAFLVWKSGQWALNQFLYENPAFAIKQITVETDGVIAQDHLREWTGVKVGDNLLALDGVRLKRNLLVVPFIQSVSVDRMLPHSLRIHVSEREPVANINVLRTRSGGGTEQLVFNVDSQGALMPPLDPKLRAVVPTQPSEQLTLITGANLIDIRPGQFVHQPQVQAAIDLILAFDRSPMAALVDLKKIDAGSPGVLTATTGQGTEVTFGLVDYDQQLRRWHLVHTKCQQVNKAIATLDLAVSNNVPTRLLEASLVPPAPNRAPISPRIRKKHV